MRTEYTSRNQPHFHHIGHTFSITLTAFDALPPADLHAAKTKRDAALLSTEALTLVERQRQRFEIHQQYEREFEYLLHQKQTQTHPFKETDVAQTLLDHFKSYHEQLYTLRAACVMSNHIHLLLDLATQVPADYDWKSELPDYINVDRIVGRLKGGASFKLNRQQGFKSNWWGDGYYDRYIRNPRHLITAFWYILNNPVKAGVVKHWADYPFTYADLNWVNVL